MKLFNKDKLPSSEAIRYAEEQTKIYKQQVIKTTNNYIQLQSNWNSLREWLEGQQKEVFHIGDKIGIVDSVSIDVLLDKMNELEGKDNNGIVD